MIKFKLNPSIKQISRDDVRYLWHSNYWDGPLSGVCLFNGERFWFHCFCDAQRHRKFVLLRLSEELWAKIDENHLMFQNYVGTHTDYDESGKRPLHLKPLIESNSKKYKEWYNKNGHNDKPTETGEQVAWYRSPCNLKSKV